MSFLSNITFTVIIPSFLITLILTFFYKLVAKKGKIIAKINSRSLHKAEVPRGAGLVFAWVFILFIYYLLETNVLNDEIFLQVCIGAGIASIFGFFDDIFNVKPI